MLEEELSWDATVKGRERLFVLHYCTDDQTFLNATASYKAAYQKKDPNGKIIKLDNATCETAASRLMKRERVKIAITRLLKMTQQDLDEKSVYKMLHDLVMYATYNPADLINANGELKTKDLKSLGELAKCITQVYQTKYGPRYVLADRSKYMTQLLQYLNIIRPEVVVDAQLPVIEMVQKAVDPESWNEIAQDSL